MDEETIDKLKNIQAVARYSANVHVMRFDLDVYDAFKLIERSIDELIEREEAREDAAECKRNGHRDSGRGQCVECDEFI